MRVLYKLDFAAYVPEAVGEDEKVFGIAGEATVYYRKDKGDSANSNFSGVVLLNLRKWKNVWRARVVHWEH